MAEADPPIQEQPPRPHPGSENLLKGPAYEPNDAHRKQILDEVLFWGTKAMAKRLGIARSTLFKYYGPEIAEANEKGVAMVAASLFKKAMAGDGASQRFFLVTRGKGEWSPKLKHEHTGPDGQPIQTTQRVIDMTRFLEGKDDAQLAIAESLLAELAVMVAEQSAALRSNADGSDPTDPGEADPDQA